MKKNILLFVLTTSVVTCAAWHNWASNYECTGKVYTPATKKELIQVINDARILNKKIRVIGNGHSFNDIACNDDYLINMRNCNRLISVDYATNRVTAQSGMTLHKLNAALMDHGLALSNLPAITQTSLAGTICTASHGTGHTGTLSSFITHIELITADGKIHQLSAQNDPEAFKAACVSLGALGVLTEITMQCEPLFYLEKKEHSLSLENLLSSYEKFHQGNDFFQCHWNTQSNKVRVVTWNRVVANAAHTYSHKTLPYANVTDLGIACEVAIPVCLLPIAIKTLQEWIQKWHQSELDISDIEMRFVNADTNSYLSPSADFDVVYLCMVSDPDTRYYALYREFEELLEQFCGRPHWGKINTLTPDRVQSLYGKNYLHFMGVKKRLDPNNTFSNEYIQRVLGA